jgi:ATP-binding cassette subfamily B protein
LFGSAFPNHPIPELHATSAFTDAINKAASTDSMFTKQVGIAFTGIFYKELGIDTSKIQSSYILNKGFEMVLITLAGAAASIGVGFFSARVAAGVAKRMRHDLFRRVESFSSHEFDQFSTASLITRSTNDVTQVQMLINMGIRMLCYAPILGAGGVIMAVHKSVSLSWIIAAAVILLLGIITVVFSVAMPKFKIIQKTHRPPQPGNQGKPERNDGNPGFRKSKIRRSPLR